MSLSDKRWEDDVSIANNLNNFRYDEEDVKEFIKKLKEKISPLKDHKIFLNNIIDGLAGEDLV